MRRESAVRKTNATQLAVRIAGVLNLNTGTALE